MSLDFQRMRFVGTTAYGNAGKTSITDRTSHLKGGVGCAAQVHGSGLGEQNLTAVVPPTSRSGYAAVPLSVLESREAFSTQLDHHLLGHVAVSKEMPQQVQIF